jgi:hypothetical protein
MMSKEQRNEHRCTDIEVGEREDTLDARKWSDESDLEGLIEFADARARDHEAGAVLDLYVYWYPKSDRRAGLQVNLDGVVQPDGSLLVKESTVTNPIRGFCQALQPPARNENAQ